MNRLWLLRHAKSDWDTGEADFDRPLKKRGRKSADCLGSRLAECGQRPELILTSPAARAVETVRRLCSAAGWPMDAVLDDQRLYGADVDTFRTVLADRSGEVGHVMVVGHNPGLEAWLRYLAPEVAMPEDGKLLPTAALASLKVNANWTSLGTGCANLEWLQRVRELQS